MMEPSFYRILLTIWFALPAVVFPLLFFLPAPYGRYARSGWGPALPSRWGWMLMEAPAALVFAGCFWLRADGAPMTPLAFLVLWEAHYLHRAFLYPLGLPSSSRPMPVLVVALGFLFNLCNAYLNGRYLFTLSRDYADEWLGSGRFLLGSALFLAGFIVNRQADYVLRRLRGAKGSDYDIPQGGLYRWICCPNYLGEMVEWIGWAMATWSLPGLAFALWTAANLVPRARSHRIWYQNQFRDYPAGRKALLPGIW